MIMAIELQRYYKRALREGFPFDRGMRIALNYGEYRLLPIEEGSFGGTRRYEFFGHGIVELSRLASGKTMREIQEIKHLLIGQGYESSAVEEFFAPAARKNIDLVDKDEEERRFYCYINQNGALINEGIVATRELLSQLDRSEQVETLFQGQDGSRSYFAFRLGRGAEELWFGVRKLGLANLKGLEQMPIYEVVDGAMWQDQELEEASSNLLLNCLDRDAGTSRASSPNFEDSRVRPA